MSFVRRLGDFDKPVFHFILIALLGLIAYSNTFNVPFQWDDRPNIVDNPMVKDFSFFSEPLKARGFPLYTQFKSRYIGYLTFALNYKLHGFDVRGYHAVNLLIHIINAFLVYYLVILTSRTPFLSGSFLKEKSDYVALFSALIFIAHPIQTQAITYIVQRFASLATMFYLLSLAAYIKSRLSEGKGGRCAFYALSIASAVLAMKTKEMTATLPLVIALYEFMFFRGRAKQRLLYLMPILLTMLIIPMTFLNVEKPIGNIIGDVSEVSKVQTEMPRATYLFTQFRVITTYIRLLLLPINQNLDYEYPVFGSLLRPEAFLSGLFLISVIAFGFYLLRLSKTKDASLRLISFGIFWFFITLMPESSLIPIVDVIFEHRVYLPSVGGYIVLVAAVLFLVGLKKELFSPIFITIFILSITYAGGTYARNTIWQTETGLWEDTVKKSPGKARAWVNLGGAQNKEKQYEDAIESLTIAINIAPGDAFAWNNLGTALGGVERYAAAIEMYGKAIALHPEYQDAWFNLGVVQEKIGDTGKAVESYKTAIELNPSDTEAKRLLKNIIER